MGTADSQTQKRKALRRGQGETVLHKVAQTKLDARSSAGIGAVFSYTFL